MRLGILFCFLLATFTAHAQEEEEYRVYTEHPRLFLTAQRLRLLKRERQRESMRWRQFDLLVRGSVQMREQGFATALYYSVTGDAAYGKRAVDWALGAGTDLRQLALVYDWCQPLLSPSQSQMLADKIHRMLDKQRPESMLAWRDRLLAVIATADGDQHLEENLLRDAIQQWWRTQYAPGLSDGRTVVALPDIYPLLELLHAVRDNLRIDLRDASPEYFRQLPKYQILGNYPAPLKAPDSEYRIPVFQGTSEPDLDRAALARAAGLCMVSYDNNALENQFLQGWLIQDRFLLKAPFGAPYEFLWANPYQPGLSYFQLQAIFHDPDSGALFVRSSWEDDADWFGLFGGEAQWFHDGKITILNQAGRVFSNPKLIPVGLASVVFGRTPLKFQMGGGTILVVGLKPQHKYLLETDDEEMREVVTDRAGTLALDYPSEQAAGVRIHDESEGIVGKGGA
jgi:hypothetical protein